MLLLLVPISHQQHEIACMPRNLSKHAALDVDLRHQTSAIEELSSVNLCQWTLEFLFMELICDRVQKGMSMEALR